MFTTFTSSLVDGDGPGPLAAQAFSSNTVGSSA